MRASLFITCYNDTLFPETGRAVVRLLERLGIELDFHPEQTCCGQMHANTGFRAEAFSQAKRFVRLYQDAEAVVIPSSSCVAMIRDQYQGGSTIMTAISGVEIALWDLVGKACGQPVYKLLGGRCHERLPSYANGWYGGLQTREHFASPAREVIASGYRAMKFDPVK